MAIYKLKRLNTLNLIKCDLNDLSGFGRINTLEVLFADDNNISSLEDTTALKDLQYLSLSYNDISSLDELKYFDNLYYLNLAQNHNLDVNTLPETALKNIRYIDISYCNLTDITRLIVNPNINNGVTVFIGPNTGTDNDNLISAGQLLSLTEKNVLIEQ